MQRNQRGPHTHPAAGLLIAARLAAYGLFPKSDWPRARFRSRTTGPLSRNYQLSGSGNGVLLKVRR